jgi:hypothetical protein
MQIVFVIGWLERATPIESIDFAALPVPGKGQRTACEYASPLESIRILDSGPISNGSHNEPDLVSLKL